MWLQFFKIFLHLLADILPERERTPKISIKVTNKNRIIASAAENREANIEEKRRNENNCFFETLLDCKI